jgi:hypothetical protein
MWIFLGMFIAPQARVHDFLNLYTGAKLALDGRFAELHNVDVQLAEEQKYAPANDRLVPFVRPHFYAALLAPMALIPFGAAFWTWIAAQTLLLFGCWYWGFRQFPADSLVFSALYLPTALGIAHGQDGVLMLVISIASYSLLRSGRHFAAGSVLALGLIKFHLFLLWPAAMLVARDWNMLAGFSAIGALEALISAALGGVTGVTNYIAMLTNKDLERLSPTPEFMINAQSIAANLAEGNMVVRIAWTVLVAAMWLIAIWRAPMWRWWAATALAGLLLVPHTYGYDAALLLLPVWLCLFENTEKRLRIVATLASTPIPFLLTLADKPWSAAAALALTAMLVAMAIQRSEQPH